MPSAGELLREERMKRNRKLSEIAIQTCISTRYLEAIESEDLSVLPGDFFYRSFIRQYAQALDLDQTTTDAILSAAAPRIEIDPLPALSAAYQTADAERRISGRYKPSIAVVTSLLVAVLAGCSGLYAWWHSTQVAKEMEVMRSEPAAPAQQPASETQSDAVRSRSVNPTPAPAPTEPGKIHVDLAATEQTWVSLSSEGKTVFSGLLDPDQTRNFAVSDRAKLTTGNAAGLDIRWNGKAIGPIGSRGQVRVVVFTPANYEILSPHRM